jgi:membrane-associated phospholipid phosphatase
MNQFERIYQFMTRPWVLLFCFSFIALSFFYFDKPIAMWADAHTISQKFPWLEWVTNLGIGVVDIVVVALVALIFRFVVKNVQWERRAWFVWICLVIPNLVCLVLKVLFGRARPDMLFSDQLYGFYGLHKSAAFWSFPSGHTTTIMGLAFGLSALFPQYIIAFIGVGSFVALSRILLLKHFLSDVLMATYLALIEVGLLYYWLSKYVQREKANH